MGALAGTDSGDLRAAGLVDIYFLASSLLAGNAALSPATWRHRMRIQAAATLPHCGTQKPARQH